MPPRRSASPLSLETCSPPSTDLDSDGIIGSDDELDSEARAVQRRRIEKLAGAYLQGKPLFILSASLRGPFDDQQWNNPWRKNRRRSGHAETENRRTRKGGDSPVVQETNPRKRRQPTESQQIRQSQASNAPSESSVSLFRSKKTVPEEHGTSSRPRPEKHQRDKPSASPASVPNAKPKTIESKLPSNHSTPVRGTDKSWLKKDRDRLIKFHNFDPPTSPTSKISSRHPGSKRRAVEIASSASHLKSPTPNQDHGSPTAAPSHVPRSADHSTLTNKSAPSNTNKDASQRDRPTGSSRLAEPEMSFSVLSSSSHLPQFEYRRRKRRSATPKKHDNIKIAASIENREHADTPAVTETAAASHQPVQIPQEESLTHSSMQNQTEQERVLQESNALTISSNTFDNVPISRSDKAPSISNPSKDISAKLPSAQIIQQNPAVSGYMTSLHSTAIPKSGAEDDEDTVPDHQFSTQAALLHAQRSFQNDLESQHHDAETPGKKRRAAELSGSESPHSNNITPFYRLSTPDYFTEGSRQPRTNDRARAPMMSTQGMIDAVTPFTFSTEKKENHRRILTPASAPGSKNQNPRSSVGHTSPASPRHNEFLFDSRIEKVPNSVQSHRVGTQHSALPMTLTGTTPPTAQEDAQDFNLSQAIAEAGSWLQQSFEINKEISQCRTGRPGPSPSSDRQTTGLDVGAIS
ncbi:hypothetical protein P170DRAFT_409696 [Aspergillus steynii IBT 23096]|uniref:Protamine P1 n=1 Tax=Aspergillus steynii IBT 23096 TaxID=1392250 RepID=A0A2I2G3T3_9EURO|nr:uncharacterized protein P170DRAFT_409696 [Aspergillus steynii IBT 23096]PLB47546.1 hypothetical protein P170DRAFT_409696 [Aspergillus steynii IBT 23096]